MTATPQPSPYVWDFNKPDRDSEGWNYATNGSGATSGVDTSGYFWETSKNASYLYATSPDYLQINASQYKSVTFRINNPRATPSDAFFEWTTSAGKSFTYSASVPLVTSTEFHVYTIDLSKNADWAGTVYSLRLELFSGPAVDSQFKTDLDSIGLVPVSAAPSITPLVGAIRWDAWFPGTSGCAGLSYSPDGSVFTDYDYRQPEYGWFDSSSTPDANCPEAGPLPNAQANMDQEIVAAHHGGLDYWAFNWYGPGPSHHSEFRQCVSGVPGVHIQKDAEVLPDCESRL